METLAEMLNEKGGVTIGGKTYDIEIVTFDDQKDPKRAIAGMEKMAQEGIHYVVGPNVDDGAAAVRPVAEANGIIYFPYAFPKELYTPPASNAVLGMVASYQSGPAIYKYLKENKGVKKVAFIAANESDPLSQRRAALTPPRRSAWRWWADVTYQNDTRDFTPVLTPVIKAQPDLLVLSGVAPGNAPLLIRSARELGYEGLISTETAQDAKVLEEGAGELANGFISVGGASTPEIASDEMKEFVEHYTKMYGEYNDELNTKVYALAYILDTLKANPKAIDDVEEFKKTMDSFEAPNPFLKSEGASSSTSAPPPSARSASSRCRWSSTSTRTASSRRCSSATSTEALPTPGPAAGPAGLRPADGARSWSRSLSTGSTSARHTR